MGAFNLKGRGMSKRNYARVAFAGVLLCMVFCTKKTAVIPAIVFNADTLTVGQAAGFDPSITNDSVRLRSVALRIVCAGGLPDSSVDSMAQRLAERLLLVSNVEWKPVAAALLLHAAERLVARIGATDACSAMRLTADSLLQLSSKTLRVAGTAPGWRSFTCDSVDLSQREGKAWLLRTVLGTSPEIANLLTEFVGMPLSNSAADSSDFKNLVAGLVSSPEDIKKEELRQRAAALKGASRASSAKPEEVPDNSAAALRFRDQKSIRDSIEKHIPNLKQLYKKNLKLNSRLAGTVVVTIRVGAAGSVIGVRIKSSNIDSKAFLDPLVTYLKTIEFKPIPEKVGAMTFDFPFEFNPEM